MQAQLPEHVRDQHVCILILLVRIAGLVADRCGKCKLRDAIESFGRDLYWQLADQLRLLISLFTLLLALLLTLVCCFVIW